jgi:hypothetical protein
MSDIRLKSPYNLPRTLANCNGRAKGRAVRYGCYRLTLYPSFWPDRVQRRRDVADAFRTAAADALAKLDRYARLPKAVAESTQTLAVETSQKLAQPPAPNDVADARDCLWAGLTKDWRDARAAQRAEGIELAQVTSHAGKIARIINLPRWAMNCDTV